MGSKFHGQAVQVSLDGDAIIVKTLD
jgi:hypothetical protein